MSETTTFKAPSGRNITVDAALWKEAQKRTEGKGDGRLGKEDAQALFDLIAADKTYSEIEKKTIKYIRMNFKWTEQGNDEFRSLIRSAATKGFSAADIEDALSDAE